MRSFNKCCLINHCSPTNQRFLWLFLVLLLCTYLQLYNNTLNHWSLRKQLLLFFLKSQCFPKDFWENKTVSSHFLYLYLYFCRIFHGMILLVLFLSVTIPFKYFHLILGAGNSQWKLSVTIAYYATHKTHPCITILTFYSPFSTKPFLKISSLPNNSIYMY